MRHFRVRVLGTMLVLLGGLLFADFLPNLIAFLNENGEVRTFNPAGAIDVSGPFFQDLGTNGRRCVTCHQPSDNWSVTPGHIQARFDATGGTDPIFRTNDGSNCNTADVSSVAARRSAYSLLLNKGLIRIALDVPAGAEFSVVSVDNPYGCSDTSTLSMYRRPLPSTNLRFLTTVMWDGRESHPGNTLEQNLSQQSDDATTGHAQGGHLTDAQRAAIVAFEIALHTTESATFDAGQLNAQGANGGPVNLSNQNFFVGINDPLGPGPFNPSAFDIFTPWSQLQSNSALAEARASVARGQALFNTKPITIDGVAGLNDKFFGGKSFTGNCTTCHNTPNVGNHSVPLPINIGLTDASRRTPDLPLFTLMNNTTHETVQTTDPARAMITGKWVDIGKTKGPILRGLSGRAPYFHNGSAATFTDVLNFYDTRFGIGFTDQEKQDLINFLKSL